MASHPPDNQTTQGNSENRVEQSANNVGEGVNQYGRDYIVSKTTNTNIHVWISLFLISILALGGLAWALNAGIIKDSGSPQQITPSGETSTEEVTKP